MMSFKALLVVALLTFGGVAHAEILYKDVPDTGCAGDMTTDGCFGTGSTPSSPTPNTCTAFRSRGQQCRSCAPKYYDNGTYAGYHVCAYVKESTACRCTNAGTSKCGNEGACTYAY